MSCIKTSTLDANGITVENTEGTIPSVIMSSIKNRDLIIETLINLVIEY